MTCYDDFATPAELRQISHDTLAGFSLNLGADRSAADFFHCSKILRCLPAKRLACVGEWRGRTLFAKLFIDSKRAKAHWQREERGIRALVEKKIPTPALIHSGVLPAGGGFYTFLEYFPNAKTTKELWDAADAANRVHLLCRLAELLARHHAVGIMQNDLHLNNFLLAGDELYTLDGADITFYDSSLSKMQSFGNLAAYFAQFFPNNDEHIEEALLYYGSIRGWKIAPKHSKIVRRLTLKYRNKRKIEFLKKTKRDCSAFFCHRQWNRFTVCDRAYDSVEIRRLMFDPDSFMAQGNPIKNGNTSTVASVTIGKRYLLIKRYNIKNWKHGISRAFRSTRAAHSWTNAHRLSFYGINTPKPVALVENRWGPLRRKAYYISEYSPGCSSYDFFLDPAIDEKRKAILAKVVARLFKKLRNLRISHGDLKASNILITGEQAILIDLDAMKEYSLGCVFKKAWKRDLKRFFKNWIEDESIAVLFKQQFEQSWYRK